MTATAPNWRPTASLEAGGVRAEMLATARSFFAAHDVLEVDTPSLSQAAASDPNIDCIAVALSADPDKSYYLHTSPEFAMKRLLCAGWPDIYQICKVYRDGEVGARHQPEFTMIEWYRRDLAFRAMMEHTVQFIEKLLNRPQAHAPAVYLNYQQAFQLHAHIDPLAASVADLRKLSKADAALSRALGNDRDAWLDLVLTTRVAPRFDRQRLTVLHHYPASQAALARLCPADARVADRFEIYCGELELANGYFELSDAAEQRKRCTLDQEKRIRRGAPARCLDENFLAALEAGLPACCGVAVGFDRLVMVRMQKKRLQDVQSFVTVDLADD